MASGPVRRANRPNTWLHRPAMRRDDFPCQLGAVHTWHKADTDVRFCICPFQDIEYAIEHIGPFAHGGWE